MRDLVIVGAGGHGRELFGTVSAINAISPTWNVLGFVDDDPGDVERVERLGTTVLGPIGWLEEREVAVAVAIGVGTPAIRRSIVERLDRPDSTYPPIIHPSASIGPDVRIGPGVLAYEQSVLTTAVRIGAHSHINVGCAVQHDSTVGEFVQLSPAVFINGDCTVGDDVFLGTGAIVTRGCAVGGRARVGAGAVVMRDVPAGATAVGVWR